MKRVMSVLLTVALMVAGIAVAPAKEAKAEGVGESQYLYVKDDLTTEVKNADCSILNYDSYEWKKGEYDVLQSDKWYVVVNPNLEIEERITVTGTVNLILRDGCKLTAKKGITVGEGSTLNIYGQSGGTGELISEASTSGQSSNAGIGGVCEFAERYEDNTVINCGEININGGKVTAKGGGSAAGIGGGNQGTGGRITIKGGEVKSYGMSGGAGIGSGVYPDQNDSGGTIKILGGTVEATGGRSGAGIGGGDSSAVETITISGGNVKAIGGENAAGIGSGSGSDGTGQNGTISISGGTVEATGGDYGAGIGAGYGSCGTGQNGTISISGGIVTATGGENAAGIGGGEDGNGAGTNGTISIFGGIVTASGGNGAKGIGAGAKIRTSEVYDSPLKLKDVTLYGGADANSLTKLADPYSTLTGYQGNRYQYMKACRLAYVSTIPTASTGLYATGASHALLSNKGAATNGEMQFALGEDSTNTPETGWSTSIPTGTEAKTYYVWYKAVGTNGAIDSEAAYVPVTISAASTPQSTPQSQPQSQPQPKAPAPTTSSSPSTPTSSGGYTPPYTPPAPEPNIGGKSGWSEIVKDFSAIPAGGTEVINMNGSITLPTTALNAIQGQDANFVFDMGNGVKWTINGKDVGGTSGDVYLGVYLGATGIPTDVINNLTGEREKLNLMLSRDSGLGFTATLTLPLKKEWAGQIANLFNYNKVTKNMDFVSSGPIRADGSADLMIGGKNESSTTKDSIKTASLMETASADQASSFYTIVIDDHSLDPNVKPEPSASPEPTVAPAPTTDPEPTVEPTPKDTTYDLNLTGTSKKQKVLLSWKKLKDVKKYRIYQKVGRKYKLVKELKNNTLTLRKSLTAKDKKEAFKVGDNYTFKVMAYIDNSWKKKPRNAVVTVKVRK